MSYALADNAPVLFYYGQSASNANRLYAYDLKGGKNRLVYDLSQDKLKDIALGEVHDWNFKSDDGTTIQGRYYLPPHFDPNKKYPMIVITMAVLPRRTVRWRCVIPCICTPLSDTWSTP